MLKERGIIIHAQDCGDYFASRLEETNLNVLGIHPEGGVAAHVSMQKCIDMLGTNEAFAYPFGDVSDAAPKALERAGYLCAFTIVNGQVKRGDDPYRLVRMRVLAESPLDGFKYEVEHGL